MLSSKTNANLSAAEYIWAGFSRAWETSNFNCSIKQSRVWLAFKSVWAAFDSGNKSRAAAPGCHFLLRPGRLLAVCSSGEYWMSGLQQHLSCWQGRAHDFIKGITSFMCRCILGVITSSCYISSVFYLFYFLFFWRSRGRRKQNVMSCCLTSETANCFKAFRVMRRAQTGLQPLIID